MMSAASSGTFSSFCRLSLRCIALCMSNLSFASVLYRPVSCHPPSASVCSAATMTSVLRCTRCEPSDLPKAHGFRLHLYRAVEHASYCLCHLVPCVSHRINLWRLFPMQIADSTRHGPQLWLPLDMAHAAATTPAPLELDYVTHRHDHCVAAVLARVRHVRLLATLGTQRTRYD